MKKLLLTILTALTIHLLASCIGDKEPKELFARVDNIMDEYPDSAFAMLDSVREQKASWRTRQQMRYEILRAKAQNKAYIDFTTDSVMKEVAAYYDKHGTPNEQMEAHYLLGCTYRDMHESPMALSCYLDATEKADTLSDDCDYRTLMRIWGQVADEFDRNGMPYKELEASKKYQRCAKKCQDTLNYIIGVELERRPYFILRDTTNVIKKFEEAFLLYKSNGYVADAALSILPVLPIYINRGEIKKTEELFMFFEKYSNLFDDVLNIDEGYEFYYGIKGKYYERINNYAKAEYYYRKLLKCGYKYDAYAGLVNIYTFKHVTDSITKYSLLKEKSFDESYTQSHFQAMFNADGMFNYARNQRIAEVKTIESKLLKSRIIIVCLSAFFVLIVCFVLFLVYKNKKKAEIVNFIKQYKDCQLKLKNAISDYDLMCRDFETFRLKKDEELQTLQQKFEYMSLHLDKSSKEVLLDKMLNNRIAKEILEKRRIIPGHNIEISTEEWDNLFNLTRDNRNQFYYAVICNQQLTDQEKKISVLSLLGKTTKETAVLLNTSLPNVSNAKKSISLKLFGDNTARNFNNKILDL